MHLTEAVSLGCIVMFSISQFFHYEKIHSLQIFSIHWISSPS